MDPISAVANALGSMYTAVGNIVTSFNTIKIEKQKTKQIAELTTQERIKYDELISSGNYTLAAQLLQSKDNKGTSSNKMVTIIIVCTFLIILLVIYLKIKQK